MLNLLNICKKTKKDKQDRPFRGLLKKYFGKNNRHY